MITIIGILIALLLPAVQAAREAARRMQCTNNLKQVSLAMLSYEQSNGAFPIGVVLYGAKGQKTMVMTTAFLRLLPFIEQQPLYNMWNWKKRNYSNPTVVSQQISSYICPSDTALGRQVHDIVYFGRSNYAVCFGSDAMTDNHLNPYGGAITGLNLTTDGAFQADVARLMSDFKDGVSNTAVASEVIAGVDDKLEDDNQVDERGVWAMMFPGASCYMHRNTPNSSAGDVCWTDSSGPACVNTLPDIPADLTGGMDLGLLTAAARSRHPGGVNVTFGDGHVSFFNNTIDLVTWKALSTVAGNEPVTAP